MCTGSKVNTALDSSQTEWLSHYLSAGLESVSRDNFIIPCTFTYFGTCSCFCIWISLHLQSLTISAIARIFLYLYFLVFVFVVSCFCRAWQCLPSPALPSPPASPWLPSGASGLPQFRFWICIFVLNKSVVDRHLFAHNVSLCAVHKSCAFSGFPSPLHLCPQVWHWLSSQVHRSWWGNVWI